MLKSKQSFKIGLYIRVSTEEQAENPEGSIKNQEDRLRTTIKLKNLESNFGEIKSVFVETKSGKNTKRPELQKMLTAIRKHEIDLVMVTELSRISRSVKDFSEIWDLMQENNCGFYSLRENFDTTTAAGEMVLLIVASLAQFERRQISERVAANFNARAKRGLFNGGCIPFGYTRNTDKVGYLVIDEDAAQIVRKAFSALIREGALMPAARWLNENGLRMKRDMEGGGNKKRIGFFTLDNLQAMVKNKMYLGIKTYKQNGETKEAEAVWPPIIDQDTFQMANAVLARNKKLTTKNEDGKDTRYPYILSGLVSCKVCGDRLSGRSAHGKKEKIGYYDHGWASKKGSHVPGLKHQCWPFRVLAKEIEPAVWREIEKILTDDKICQELFAEVSKLHKSNPTARESEKYRQTIYSLDEKLETLSERLASLPRSVSPTPVYHQMEKFESLKKEAQERLSRLASDGASLAVPVELSTYAIFRDTLYSLLRQNGSSTMRTQIARYLIRWIKVHPDGFDINWAFGDNYIKCLIASWSHSKTHIARTADFEQKKGTEGLTFSPDSKNSLSACSSMLTIGAAGRSRTCDHHIRSVVLYPAELRPHIKTNANHEPSFLAITPYFRKCFT
jgi:site-specific DNA recombinase